MDPQQRFLLSFGLAAIFVVLYFIYRDIQKKKGSIGSIFDKPKTTSLKGVYKNKFEAAADYTRIITERLINDEFYKIKVHCNNCQLKGTVYIPKEVKAEGYYCPSCDVNGLQVIGKGDSNIVFRPSMGEQTKLQVEELVESLVETGLSTGKISRDGIFN